MSAVRRVAVPVLLTVAATGSLVGCSDDIATGHAVSIHHSAFRPALLTVPVGRPVTLRIRNDDPIDHELVVGDGEVHRLHANGSERRHPPVPGEVSVAPGDTSMTFYEFTEPGSIVYACHLPGHVAYGMAGTIEVVPAR